jgi:hypothetical protein
MATRYDERNQIQCVKCNMFEQGMQWQFGLNLDAKYGLGTAEEMQFKARKIQKFSRIDYEENISYYKSCVNKLKKEKGIE